MSDRRLLALAVLACLAALLPGLARANGGQVRIDRQRVGPYDLTVTTSPTPLRVGLVDVSALVQRPGSDAYVLDARVLVTAEPRNGGEPIIHEATHDQATEPNYYAAEFEIPSAGTWRFTVRVEGPDGQGEAAFEAEVAGEGLFDRAGWVVWVIAGILGAGALWWLFSARGGDEEDDAEAGGEA
ncbi:MAG: hypothetical protein QJR03_12530 [Sphaerobacter sp.]|nr:hypothetical protein [Sphaerobacter sp.]